MVLTIVFLIFFVKLKMLIIKNTVSTGNIHKPNCPLVVRVNIAEADDQIFGGKSANKIYVF
jgi:hypothetical protein